jgi:hypothetical protein
VPHPPFPPQQPPQQQQQQEWEKHRQQEWEKYRQQEWEKQQQQQQAHYEMAQMAPAHFAAASAEDRHAQFEAEQLRYSPRCFARVGSAREALVEFTHVAWLPWWWLEASMRAI